MPDYIDRAAALRSVCREDPTLAYTIERVPGPWRDAREDNPDPDADGDWVIGVVNARFDGIEYINAVELVSYEPDLNAWYLHEDPTRSVAVLWWMPLPEPPEPRDGRTA